MLSMSTPGCTGTGPPAAVEHARQFARHLATLLENERAALVRFLLALVEFDGRRLWADLGYASLFDFLHRELGMSTGAAFYRKTAVALIHRFPEVADALADGRLCITSLGAVAKVVTPENARDVLPRFFHRSRREAREVAAAIAPDTAPPHRDVITTVASDTIVPVDVSASRRDAADLPGSDVLPNAGAAAPDSDAAARTTSGDVSGRELRVAPPSGSELRMELRRVPAADHVEPLTASLRRLHMTVSERWVRKLDALRAALSHSHPAGRAEEITEYALDVALEHIARKNGVTAKRRRSAASVDVAAADPPEKGRAKATRRPSQSRVVRERRRNPPQRNVAVNAAAPRTPARPGGSAREHIPAEVRRRVNERDGGRCQWKLHDGTLCGSNVRVQLDHVHPVALGGKSTIDNLRLLCARHNQLAARRAFGEAWMERFTAPRRADSS